MDETAMLGGSRLLLNVTLPELDQIVTGLSMLPVAEQLHRRLAAHLHVQRLCGMPPECRRVWWRSFRDGVESAIEWYDPSICDRIDRAVKRASRKPRR